MTPKNAQFDTYQKMNSLMNTMMNTGEKQKTTGVSPKSSLKTLNLASNINISALRG